MTIRKRPFSYDPITKIRKNWYTDEESGESWIGFDHDVTDIVEYNKAMHAATDENARHNDGISKVATIPLTVLFDLIKKGIIPRDSVGSDGAVRLDTKDAPRFRKWLNSNEHVFFRTRPGRV